MRINILTLFPEYFTGPLDCGLLQRARQKGLLDFTLINPRDLATDKHRSVDDRPYGGGPGMVMLAGPLSQALQDLGFTPFEGFDPARRLLLLSPAGKPLDQSLARELALGAGGTALDGGGPASDANSPASDANSPASDGGGLTSCGSSRAEASLTLICGRYEGLDARLEEIFPCESVSVGDFVLNGGEAAALALIEAVSRLLPGFMGHEESGEEESHSAGLLEYPHYTRPEVFEGLAIPELLSSGDHGKIALWRRQAALRRTFTRRPELLDRASLSGADLAFLASLPKKGALRHLSSALVHYPVLDRDRNSVAVSLTNLDIHDIARSSCAYGLGAYYVISPMRDQLELLESLLAHWQTGAGSRSNPDRKRALGLVRAVQSIEEAVAVVSHEHGTRPFVCATSASAQAGPVGISYAELADMLARRPVLLLFGTGHGLAPEALELCNAVLPPIRPCGAYNHLSVRAAAAVTFDRLAGNWR